MSVHFQPRETMFTSTGSSSSIAEPTAARSSRSLLSATFSRPPTTPAPRR